MKSLNTIVKLLTALATVAGAVYIIATYGEQIVAWAKQILEKMPKCPCAKEDEVLFDEPIVVTSEETSAPAEEPVVEEAAPVEEVPAEEPAAEEEPAPEIVVAEHEPVAEDADFAE